MMSHLTVERECAQCKTKIKGPVYFRHVKVCGVKKEDRPKVKPRSEDSYQHYSGKDESYMCERVCKVSGTSFRCGNIVRVIDRNEKRGGFVLQSWDKFVPDSTELVWGTRTRVIGEGEIVFERCFKLMKGEREND